MIGGTYRTQDGEAIRKKTKIAADVPCIIRHIIERERERGQVLEVGVQKGEGGRGVIWCGPVVT